jgi:DNA-directed RNA polymerase specialized sigma24 family protein
MDAVGMGRLFLTEMPVEDRDLIRLKYHDDLRYSEISQRICLPWMLVKLSSKELAARVSSG